MTGTTRFFLSAGALCLGLGILGVSLMYGSSPSYSASSTAATRKELYFDEQMLPDHVLYPVLMAVDRAKLEAAPPLEQIYLKTEYANRRLKYAQELLIKDKSDLAYSTLTKSQKYLLHAANDTLAHDDIPQNTRSHVARTLEFHVEEQRKLAEDLTDAQRAQVDAFIADAKHLIDRLST